MYLRKDRTSSCVFSVMSGIITGPYFKVCALRSFVTRHGTYRLFVSPVMEKKFFGDPSALSIGSMVAVLEVGAFSEHSLLSGFRVGD
jgi:hypothetical protein